MKHKHLFILICVLGSILSLKSQAPQVVYDTTLFWTQAVERIKTLVPDDSGGVYTIGHVPDRGFGGHRGIAVGRWDDQGYGRVVDYGVPGKDDHAFGAWRYEDRIIAVGYRNKDSIPVRATGFPSQLISTEIDMTSGLVVRERVYEEYLGNPNDYSQYGYLNWIRPMGEGLYLAAGFNNLALFKEDGEMLWSRKYLQDSTYALLPLGTLLGDKIVVWMNWVKGTQPGQIPYYIQGYGLAFFDRYSGEFLGVKEQQILKHFYTLTHEADTIIAIGKIPFKKLNLRTGLDTLFYYPGMIKYNLNGDSISTQLFDFPGDDMKYQPYTSHLLPDGTLLQGGNIYSYPPRIGDVRGYILRYDPQKDAVLWKADIIDHEGYSTQVENIAISTQGDIYVTVLNSSMRLIRLSPDSTLRPLSRTPVHEPLTVRLMPNPARERVRVQTATAVDVHIMDLQGKTIRKQNLPTSGYIGLQGLSPGLYIWRATDAQRRMAHGKLQVE